MIKAELRYNPYTLETMVLFNGQPPRINSLVEKYQKKPLIDWIDRIPYIFYDEMNGYDFELEFSGTKLDFCGLCQSFDDAGVDSSMVKLFHKTELNERLVKQKNIEDLIEWLKENQNCNFDFSEFMSKYHEHFEGSYQFVFVNGKVEEDAFTKLSDVSIENVATTEELKNTDLHNTPILFFVDRKFFEDIQNEVARIMSFSGVSQNQLFFIFDSHLEKSIVKRFLTDIGIVKPCIVDSVNSEAVCRYVELYPVTEFIRESIKLFRKETDFLSEKFKIAKDENEARNKDAYRIINKKTDDISVLKYALNQFIERDNIDALPGWEEAQNVFLSTIRNWKIKKTKITKVSDAISAAKEFEELVRSSYNSFILQVNKTHDEGVCAINDMYRVWYVNTHCDVEFHVPKIDSRGAGIEDLPKLASALVDKRSIRIVEVKDDIFGRFIKKYADEDEPEIETTFYYQVWREFVLETVKPYIDRALDYCNVELQKYSDKVADEYISHIKDLIALITEEKESEEAKLSDEEKKLQADTGWLEQFCDRLTEIERR